MGKISPVGTKYIIHSSIIIEGIVDKPDVIGAIFGQTEGLLGADLELRELQRSGRIGRIEVNVDARSGKTNGDIIIPSSLDKAESSIVAAALEIIERIGPCNAKVKTNRIEDVRLSKRKYVIERAKELLKTMIDSVLPDSQELAEEVSHSVRVMEIRQFGTERLPSGPQIEESDEIILVEGRADVLNLLKHGFKNAIALNGTSVPSSLIPLCKEKVVTVFVDGDRGGNLILKELFSVADVDFVTRAPDGKEVEEITKKEIHKALRSRITFEQAKHELDRALSLSKPRFDRRRPIVRPKIRISSDEKEKFKKMLGDLVGTRGGYILDRELKILGKVPVSELDSTIKNLNSGMYAVVFDGSADRNFAKVAEDSKVSHIVCMNSRMRNDETPVNIVTISDI
jgi:DNA primase